MAQYYVGSFSADSNALYHHGIKGQKWGVRRFQNEDGSLTSAGRQRYKMSEAGEKAKNELHDAWSRMEGRTGEHAIIREGDARGGLDPEQVDKRGKKFRVSGIDDWKFFETTERNAADSVNLAEKEARYKKARNVNVKTLGLIGRKELKKAEEAFEDASAEYYDKVMTTSVEFIKKLPKRERDIYRDYVYRRLGFDW